MNPGNVHLLSVHKEAKTMGLKLPDTTIRDDGYNDNDNDNDNNYGYSDHNADVDEEEEYAEEEDLDDGTHDYGVIMTRYFNIDDEDMNSDLDEDEVDHGEVFGTEGSSGSSSGRRCSARQVFSSAPDFSNVFQHTQPTHLGHTKLPPALLLQGTMRPIHFFSLFFTEEEFEDLSGNTNANAALQGVTDSHQHHEEEKDDHGGDDDQSAWQDTTAKELRVYIGILIYMGIFPQDYVEEFWNTSPYYPKHRFISEMSLTRFKQMRRYFHVADPKAPQKHWYSKLEPL
ncbi:hypothetical protein BGZ96_005799 [Linnemannia gamsii]|uniref:PiggyBac transposable element-derived protein domain-containing protein n=1 Tax=Linnemannia gamsii TaxID=64522 RepID=A0ABQ7K5X2_9FUNG|nr:hypothetical protein BGZ96_005799 [Linnemannia gamsii]